MVQAITPDAANEAFDEGILPKTSGSGYDLLHAQAVEASLKRLPINGIAIPKQELRDAIPRKRLVKLLGGPRRGGMLGHVEMDRPAAVMGRDHQDKEHLCGFRPMPG